MTDLTLALILGSIFIAIAGLMAFVVYDAFATRYRYWHVLNLEKLADDRWACGVVARALEIEDDAGNPAEYVRFALLEELRLSKEKSHD